MAKSKKCVLDSETKICRKSRKPGRPKGSRTKKYRKRRSDAGKSRKSKVMKSRRCSPKMKPRKYKKRKSPCGMRKSPCPPGYELINGTCRKQCPSGKVREGVNGRCVDSAETKLLKIIADLQLQQKNIADYDIDMKTMKVMKKCNPNFQKRRPGSTKCITDYKKMFEVGMWGVKDDGDNSRHFDKDGVAIEPPNYFWKGTKDCGYPMKACLDDEGNPIVTSRSVKPPCPPGSSVRPASNQIVPLDQAAGSGMGNMPPLQPSAPNQRSNMGGKAIQ